MTTEQLLSTRFKIPPQRPNLVLRPRLVQGLNEGLRLGQRLTLVAAPAGFGKTTLIREWIAGLTGESTAQSSIQNVHAQDPGRTSTYSSLSQTAEPTAGDRLDLRPAVAWLTVDETDNDPATFLSYVIAALQQSDDGLGQEVRPLLAPGSEEPGHHLLTALINELGKRPRSLVLVLDDYHLIADYTIHDRLEFLLENQPAGLHVVIGSREDPPLPLARLRARGQLNEVREQALRFTNQETAAFLNTSMALDLTPEAIYALESRTEGWITGLQLAGLALRHETNVADFVTAFAGDDRYVMDYLVSEVLQKEPEPVQHFLRQTAILDRFTAPLCDALTGLNNGQQMLTHLEQSNLFVVPLDRRREWYRYHGLFAEVLRLVSRQPEEEELHRRAAVWYQAAGMVDQAEQHMLAYRRLAAGKNDLDLVQPAQKQLLVEPLSQRELEVLVLIAEGHSNAEIGQQLYIATGTVKRHINNIYGKLEVKSRTQAIAKARQLGLLSSACLRRPWARMILGTPLPARHLRECGNPL